MNNIAFGDTFKVMYKPKIGNAFNKLTKLN